MLKRVLNSNSSIDYLLSSESKEQTKKLKQQDIDAFKQSASKYAIIDLLKMQIERDQIAIDYACDVKKQAQQALNEAEFMLRVLKNNKDNNVRTLALIADAKNVDIDWHGLGETCDDENCEQCFEE